MSPPTVSESGEGRRRTDDGVLARGLIGVAAAALVLASTALPLWETHLEAPQYPDGLHMVAYGDRIEGDLAEIESLNHYIGMSPIRIEDLPELAAWPLALGLAVIAVAVSVIGGRRLAAKLARLYVLLLPLGILATVQVRLYQYGHDLDPGAALRIGEFTPWVVGPTRVWNFTAWGRPGTGVIALLLAAAVLTFGPRVAKRIRARSPKMSLLVGVVAVAMAWAAMPAIAHDGHSGTTTDAELATLLNGVPDGGTLVLPSGTYRGDVVIDRPVRIEGQDMPLILGSGTGTVLTVRAAGTVIIGIRVAGSGPGPTGHPAGIRIEADDVEVQGVVVEDSYTAIAVVDSARVRLVDNSIAGRNDLPLPGEGHALGDHEHQAHGSRGDGLSLWNAEGVLVRGNRVSGVRDGIYLSFGSGALLDGNQISDSRYGVHSMYAINLVLVENLVEGNLSGAVLMYGGPTLLLRNDLRANSSPSTGFGVLLKDVADVEVVENVFVDNRVGLQMDGPSGGTEPARFRANTVALNQIGVALYPSAGAVFQANTFAGNVVQVLQQGRGALENTAWSHHGFGNYWSNYRGFEIPGTGKGAIAHVEGSAVDRLLTQAPVLMPLASSPALRLVRAVEDRWVERRPVLVDDLPLTRPLSPALGSPPRELAAGAALAGLGLGAFGLATIALARLSRTRITKRVARAI